MVGLLAHRWQLVTVTNSNGLRGILSSMYFQPSFCLEKAEYLLTIALEYFNVGRTGK